ncbi:MFS transporter [Saccharothrix syringae]|uniref:MFS transporter n=1 Tax=Saccharothrix syringae TaxID=103733 RepID=A0A5Q0GUV6_SACSY|nr:MFS transporter [Saccharothrix syringae]QFZ17788.1 MFS transporter [Saccharothrix syringae]
MTSPTPTGTQAAPGAGLRRSLMLLMAVACGVVVANLYYIQPLLPDLARDFGVAPGAVGSGVVVTQVGYAVGLVLLVPLGDLVAQRALVVTMLAAGAVALAATALAGGPAVLLACLAVVGLASTTINVLIQLAATLARPQERGKAVGTLMTGLFLGVLLARTASGALGDAAGWRAVYAGAAVLLALLAAVMRVALPDLPARRGASYPQLLLSVVALVRSERFLRRRMAFGLLGFASFQLLWTSLPFLLSEEPYGYSSTVIGMFGLIGAAGVLCAQVSGRLLDRGLAHPVTGVLVLLLAVAWAANAAGATLLVPLLVGIVLLDIGVQGVHVLNQTRIYTYPDAVRSRVTTAYMTSYFLGGALGGGLAVLLVQRAGWPGVCVAGGVLALLAGALWVTDRRITPVLT